MNINSKENNKEFTETRQVILATKILFYGSVLSFLIAFLYNGLLLLFSAIDATNLQNYANYSNVLFASKNAEGIFYLNPHFYVITAFIGIGLSFWIGSITFIHESKKLIWKKRSIPHISLTYMFLVSALLFIFTIGLTPKQGVTNNFNDNYFLANINLVYAAPLTVSPGNLIPLFSSNGIEWPYYVVLAVIIFLFVFYLTFIYQNIRYILFRKKRNKQKNQQKQSTLSKLEALKNDQDDRKENKEEKEKLGNLNTNTDLLFQKNDKSDEVNKKEVEKLIEDFRRERLAKKKAQQLEELKAFDDENYDDEQDDIIISPSIKVQAKDKIIANLEDENQPTTRFTRKVDLPTIKLKADVIYERLTRKLNQEQFQKDNIESREKLEEITRQKLENISNQSIVKIKETRGPLITKVELSQDFIDNLKKEQEQKQQEQVVVKETPVKVITKKKESFVDKEIKERLKKFYE